VAILAAGAGILAQIAYPLESGPALTRLSLAAVALLTVSVLAHALAAFRVAGTARFLLAASGFALVTEVFALRTGLPFGAYGYRAALGRQLAGVPLPVLAAWTTMAYPALLLARRLATGGRRLATGGRRLRVAGLGGLTLAAWDLFLDPQLVSAGFWTWHHPDPALPGVPGVPITNLIGWLLAGTLLTALLDRLLPPAAAGVSEAVPAALLAWTWLGSTLANLAFFDRPALAGYGFAALGATVAPYLWRLLRDGSR
jgi:uncharacterized membrane protein